MAIAEDACAVRAVALLLGWTGPATDILPRVGLVVVPIGATQAATGSIGCAVLIIAPVHEGRRIEVLVARVIGEDRDATMVVKPEIIGSDVIGCVPQGDLPRQDWDREGGAMLDELGPLLGIGRTGGVAQGQFQTERAVQIGGSEMGRVWLNLLYLSA
jgi:hypothetical protein